MNDSELMRFRLAKLIGKDRYQLQGPPLGFAKHKGNLVPHHRHLQDLAEDEIGIEFNTRVDGKMRVSWVYFLQKLDIKLLLNVITTIYKEMVKLGRQGDFIAEVNRIFREENTAYEVDDEGGVHPVVDAAFAVARQAAIRGMADPRYALSRLRVEEIDAALTQSPPNYVAAIRAVFGATENLFKLIFNTPRLDVGSAKTRLSPMVQGHYKNDAILQGSSAKVLNSFYSWIDAAHRYHHEQGKEDPSQPDEDLAIVLISEGLAFLRWLVGVDKSCVA